MDAWDQYLESNVVVYKQLCSQRILDKIIRVQREKTGFFIHLLDVHIYKNLFIYIHIYLSNTAELYKSCKKQTADQRYRCTFLFALKEFFELQATFVILFVAGCDSPHILIPFFDVCILSYIDVEAF